MATRPRIKRCSITLFGVLAAAGLPLHAARAQSGTDVGPHVATYRPVVSPDGAPGLRVDLSYTFGTHQFQVREVRGEVRVDWTGTPTVAGRLTVPLTALGGGGETLTCHMQEAMGLDYARSAFPGSHVCSGGHLPATGNDAIAFPEISFEIKSAKLTTPAEDHNAGATGGGAKARIHLTVTGRWTIHGVSRDDTLDLELIPLEGEPRHPRLFRLEGMRKIRLAHYGVQVKRALVISAGEDATVRFNLVLKARA